MNNNLSEDELAYLKGKSLSQLKVLFEAEDATRLYDLLRIIKYESILSEMTWKN